MDVDKFKRLPIMGILRGVKPESIDPLVEAVVSAGLETIEIAMNTPEAAECIKRMVGLSKGRLMVGAGTVLDVDDLCKAMDSGATFIVSPTLVKPVADYCVKNNVPVFPGAFTPQEIYDAWSAGAAMVKVFPVKFFGPQYLKEVRAPFPDIELLACGGVNKENIKSFFDCGAKAIAFGSSIFKGEWIESGDFSSIKEKIGSLIEEYSKIIP